MLYWLGYEKLYHLYSPFRVFQYATFRTGMAFFTALLLSILLGPWLIARLRQFQIGQHIREDGPKSHLKKAGNAHHGRFVDRSFDSRLHAFVGQSDERPPCGWRSPDW